jgi:RNA polymerase sigma-70 factor (ECF subfamily)
VGLLFDLQIQGYPMNDAELVRQAQQGRAAAFEALFARWSERLIQFCEKRGIAHDLAEDLMQEAMWRAHRSLGTLTKPASFGAWATGIALRIHRDRRKRRSSAEQSFTSLGRNDEIQDQRSNRRIGGECAMEPSDDIEAIRREIDRLPPDQQEALRLYYSESLTYRELAKRLGVSVATVNSRLTKARKTLRERLKARRDS